MPQKENMTFIVNSWRNKQDIYFPHFKLQTVRSILVFRWCYSNLYLSRSELLQVQLTFHILLHWVCIQVFSFQHDYSRQFVTQCSWLKFASFSDRSIVCQKLWKCEASNFIQESNDVYYGMTKTGCFDKLLYCLEVTWNFSTRGPIPIHPWGFVGYWKCSSIVHIF